MSALDRMRFTKDTVAPSRRLAVAIAGVAFILLLRPFLSLEFILGYDALATSILIWMMIALSFNLLLGVTGLLSFGHAAFLGLGVYIPAIVLSRFDAGFLPAVALTFIVTCLVGYGIARLIVDKGEIYFAILTLAFGQIIWYIFNYNPLGLTGGSDGIAQGVLPSWIETSRGIALVSLGGLRFEFYWLVGIMFVAYLYVLYRIVTSPFGQTLTAIRENQELARSIGIDTTMYKIYAFTLSAVFTALAGTLLVVNQQVASLNAFHWETSGNIVMMTVVGGANTFIGPVVGAFIWMVGADYLTAFSVLHLPFVDVSYDVNELMDHWAFLFGLLFILILYTNPRDGAVGALRQAGRRAWSWIDHFIGDTE